MKIKILFFTLIFSFVYADPEFLKKYENSGNNAVERWENMAAEAYSYEPEKRIEYLSRILISDEDAVGPHMIKTYKRIQRILLETPGHAEYFGKQLKKYPKHTSRTSFFQYLENLPSVETVGVLGEMLMDDRSRPELAEDGSNLEEYAFAYPNCDYAAQILQKMLANPPVAKDSDYDFLRDLPTWRQWFEDVKAGRQTFRFVGDPVEYTLRGPSKRGAVEPGPRDRKRNPEALPEGETADQPTPPFKPRFLAYLIGVAFVLGGYILYRRGKRKGA